MDTVMLHRNDSLKIHKKHGGQRERNIGGKDDREERMSKRMSGRENGVKVKCQENREVEPGSQCSGLRPSCNPALRLLCCHRTCNLLPAPL